MTRGQESVVPSYTKPLTMFGRPFSHATEKLCSLYWWISTLVMGLRPLYNLVDITLTSPERHGVSNHRQIKHSLKSMFMPTAGNIYIYIYKLLYTDPLWGRPVEKDWFPHKGSVMRKVFSSFAVTRTWATFVTQFSRYATYPGGFIMIYLYSNHSCYNYFNYW